MVVFALFLLVPLWCAANEEFPAIEGPCNLNFPRDHSAHPDYRVEWWYYTGNLQSESGARFGFQLTFFRIRLIPTGEEKKWPDKRSAWRTSQVFAAHAALSDISSKRFHHAEKMARYALELSGSVEENGSFEVFVQDWKALIGSKVHRLFADAPDFSLDLELIPLKNPVPHGESGYSRKGEKPDQASCYYSITRLDVAGRVTADGVQKTVSGSAWMDHEFSSVPLDPHFAGWDWFSLQFSDGSDLMIYLMREKDGQFSPVSNGTFVRENGEAVRLTSGDIMVTPSKRWRSPDSGAVYPASWVVEVLPLELKLSMAPAMANQEMQTPDSTRITYWEGCVVAEGIKAGISLKTQGYAELTGYAGTVEF